MAERTREHQTLTWLPVSWKETESTWQVCIVLLIGSESSICSLKNFSSSGLSTNLKLSNMLDHEVNKAAMSRFGADSAREKGVSPAMLAVDSFQRPRKVIYISVAQAV